MDLQIFHPPFIESREIRTIIEGGEPLFVASDVAHNLGYRMASDMTRRLDPEDRGTRSVRTPSGDQDMTVITESGLYEAILGSQIAAVKEFKRWVTREVLPSIRKTGSYTATTTFQVPKTLSEALRLAADLSDKVEAQALQIEVQKPAVEFVEKFVEAKQTQNFRDVAKVLKIKQNDFVDLLLSKGILFRSRGKLSPKSEHLDAGRFEVKEIVTRGGFATVQMRFTTAGVEWIARKVSEWNQKAVVA